MVPLRQRSVASQSGNRSTSTVLVFRLCLRARVTKPGTPPPSLLRQILAIVEASDAAIFAMTPGGVVLTWNPGAERITGVAADAAVGAPLARVMSDREADELEDSLVRATGGEAVTWPHARFKGANGGETEISLILAPVRDGDGRVTAITGIGRDKTELTSVEQALAETEARWRRLIEHSPDHLMVTDQHGAIRYVSRTPAGQSREDVIGRHAFEFASGAAREQGRLAYERALSSGKPVDLEIQEDPQPGLPERRWYWVRLVPFVEPDGSATVVLSRRDITTRKRLEFALIDSEERYRLATEAGRMSVWRIDLATGHLEIHGPMDPFGGYTMDELATLDALIGVAHPEDRPRLSQALRACVEGRADRFDLEFRIAGREGRIGWVATQGGSVRDLNGRVLALVGTTRDITEHKESEARERALESKLQQAQKLESLGVLAGGIAHDFNNLLTSILGNADLSLMELEPGSRARHYIETALQSARRAAELTQQMLAYSGKGRFVVQPVNLAGVVHDMMPLLQASISKRSILRQLLAPTLPPIEADLPQLRQVVMNLVINASEAMGDHGGEITVSVGRQWCDRRAFADAVFGADNAEGEYVYLEVRDSGVGMTPEVRARIFDPFFSTKFTGRGLGLPAVLGIVRGHRGTIRVDSLPDKGTTFRVLFPAAMARAGTWPGGAGSRPATPSQGLALVVDDEEPVRMLACDMLQRLGFEVISAVDGQQALERFRERPADVTFVLLDLTMPRLDGEECVGKLREIRADVPILLTSGYDQQTVAVRLSSLNLAGFLQKPYRFEDLATAVRASIRPVAAAKR
jgi:PAS domain S-box-containing protein